MNLKRLYDGASYTGEAKEKRLLVRPKAFHRNGHYVTVLMHTFGYSPYLFSLGTYKPVIGGQRKIERINVHFLGAQFLVTLACCLTT